MFDEYAKVANKIYTNEFLIFLDTIPRNKTDAKAVLKMANEIGKLLDKKKLATCLLALTFYLPSVIVDNHIDFDRAMEDIKEFKGEGNAEKYIQ